MRSAAVVLAITLLAWTGFPAHGGTDTDATQGEYPIVEEVHPDPDTAFPVTTEEIEVHFSEPMNTAVPADTVASLSHEGETVQANISWGEDGASLTLHMELEVGALYTLVVNTNATDTEGNPLDGNANGTQDGADDTFHVEFGTELPPQPAGVSPWLVAVLALVALVAAYGIGRASRRKG